MTTPAAHDVPILPPSTLGVLGGGQLGRYFVMAARTMGYRTMVLEPDANAPAGLAADVHLIAPYDDAEALRTLAATCAAVTTEFENPPADAVATLEQSTIVRPSAAAIRTTQDRRSEKRFLRDAGIPVVPFEVIETTDDLARVSVALLPAILKTARLGYDGKGQYTVDGAAALAAAWRDCGEVPCVLEQRLPLDGELSVVLARAADGTIECFPPAANHHASGILDLTVVPAEVPGDVAVVAQRIACAVAVALHYVGVMAVEFFVVGRELLVNEIAPRPHNSGHWSLDGAVTDQFEQQVRTLCGLPLGSGACLAGGVAMVNLLGDVWDAGQPAWDAALRGGETHLHLYGKIDPRPGRKMGHITALAATPRAAATAALASRAHARRTVQLDQPPH